MPSSSHTEQVVLDIPIASVFFMPGQGLVLQGQVTSGEVYVGQTILINCPDQSVEARVLGIEMDKVPRTSAEKGQSIALLFEDIGMETIASGLERLDDGSYRVKSMQISPKAKRWWQFW